MGRMVIDNATFWGLSVATITVHCPLRFIYTVKIKKVTTGFVAENVIGFFNYPTLMRLENRLPNNKLLR
ncbi:MAG: hypothetical protein RL248_462 [Pseudomonadota bacterium]